jgi:TonB family protein
VEAVNPTPDKVLDQLGAVPKLSQDNRPKFVVPAARMNVTVAHVKEMDAAPDEPAGGGLPTSGPSLSELNIAVVGLDPGPKNAPLPEGSHAAQFSAGPKLNPNGGAGEGNPNASLTVPDLMVKGGGADAKATMLAINRAAPTSVEALRGMSKYAAPSASAPETSGSGSTGHPTAARVSNAPDPRFQGREVYSMAIQMPNITSYVGSWLMWYASRGVTREGPMAAPVPYRKVDPKYVATAVADRIEGRVQLLCVINTSGRVNQVELIRGLDPRLDKSAMEALAKWEFTPATRSGVPVDVDVMVEIPFRLAPKEPK